MVAGEDLDQGGLAGPVVAQQAHDLVGADLEVDVVQRGHLAEGLGDVLQLQESSSIAPPRREEVRRGEHAPAPARSVDGYRMFFSASGAMNSTLLLSTKPAPVLMCRPEKP